MSNESILETGETGSRKNFASRLLNKTMSERRKTEERPLTTADAAVYAVIDEEKEPVAAGSK